MSLFKKQVRFISFQNATIRVKDISGVNREAHPDGTYRVSVLLNGSGVMIFGGLSDKDSVELLEIIRGGLFKG